MPRSLALGSAKIKPGFIAPKPHDAAEYLATLGMTPSRIEKTFRACCDFCQIPQAGRPELQLPCYDFLPFFRRGLPGAGSGFVRFKYHCWPIPTTLLVRIYTARPLG